MPFSIFGASEPVPRCFFLSLVEAAINTPPITSPNSFARKSQVIAEQGQVVF